MKTIKYLAEVTEKDIEKAYQQTRTRWVRISKVKTYDKVKDILQGTHCGFCLLDTKVNAGTCFGNKCPINDTKTGCCKAWRAICKPLKSITIKQSETVALVERMDAFDIPALMKTINNAIKLK